MISSHKTSLEPHRILSQNNISVLMKFTIFTSLLLVSRASAFVPSTSRSAFGVGTKLYNAKVDSSQAVQAALEASKKYGVTSKEAQALWDAVEEMDASDNR